MKIISGMLVVLTVYLNTKHGWSALTNSMSPEEAKMFAALGLSRTTGRVLGIAMLVSVALILIPQTFFAGNLLSATVIFFIIALALKTGNVKLALIEIPFLLIPLIMIYLKHPLQKLN
jgi:hypothetical protein